MSYASFTHMNQFYTSPERQRSNVSGLASRFSVSLPLAGFSLLAVAALAPAPALAQVAILSATTLTTDVANTNHENLVFRNTTVALQTFTTASETYSVTGQADLVFIRRSAASNNQANIWYQTASAPATAERIAPYADTLQEVLLDNNLARGVHNLFGNSGTGNANIERVDFVTPSGFAANSGFAIPVFDFGASLIPNSTATNHESFRIALITGVDASNNPTAYSKLASTAPFRAPNIYTHDSFAIHRYNTGNNASLNARTEVFLGSNQGPGGLVFTLSDFMVDPGVQIYGYSLFGFDVPANASSAQLVDWNNATNFPTNTSSAEQAAGGFDFSGVNGIYFSVVPEPSTYSLAGLVLAAATVPLRRRRRARA